MVVPGLGVVFRPLVHPSATQTTVPSIGAVGAGTVDATGADPCLPSLVLPHRRASKSKSPEAPHHAATGPAGAVQSTVSNHGGATGGTGPGVALDGVGLSRLAADHQPRQVPRDNDAVVVAACKGAPTHPQPPHVATERANMAHIGTHDAHDEARSHAPALGLLVPPRRVASSPAEVPDGGLGTVRHGQSGAVLAWLVCRVQKRAEGAHDSCPTHFIGVVVLAAAPRAQVRPHVAPACARCCPCPATLAVVPAADGQPGATPLFRAMANHHEGSSRRAALVETVARG